MVASSIHILDRRGKPLISRIYRNEGINSPPPILSFFKLLSECEQQEAGSEAGPILYHSALKLHFLYIRYASLFFVAVSSEGNSNAFVIFEFLNRLLQVLKAYFDDVQEESIKDNFVLIYELLDEMFDFGYPQITEYKVLKEYITQQSHRFSLAEQPQHQSIPASATSTLSSIINWRPQGLKYKKNEAYLDVIESLNMLVNVNGGVVHSEVLGTIRMKCYLSGMPEVKLGLNDKILSLCSNNLGAKNDEPEHLQQLGDLKFHTCVRLATFESERIISFTPPDGEFDLLTYRIKPPTDAIKPIVMVNCKCEFVGDVRMRYNVIVSLNIPRRKATTCSLELFIPVPSDADTPKFEPSIGTVKYVPEADCVLWKIRHFPAGITNEFRCIVHFGLPTVRIDEHDDKLPPIRVNFELPYFAISGAQVKYLKVVERSGYEAMPWVRYLTRNGDYQIRMPEIRRPLNKDR